MLRPFREGDVKLAITSLAKPAWRVAHSSPVLAWVGSFEIWRALLRFDHVRELSETSGFTLRRLRSPQSGRNMLAQRGSAGTRNEESLQRCRRPFSKSSKLPWPSATA